MQTENYLKTILNSELLEMILEMRFLKAVLVIRKQNKIPKAELDSIQALYTPLIWLALITAFEN